MKKAPALRINRGQLVPIYNGRLFGCGGDQRRVHVHTAVSRAVGRGRREHGLGIGARHSKMIRPGTGDSWLKPLHRQPNLDRRAEDREIR